MAKVLKIRCNGCGKTVQVTTTQADEGQIPVLTCTCNTGSTVVSVQTFSVVTMEEENYV